MRAMSICVELIESLGAGCDPGWRSTRRAVPLHRDVTKLRKMGVVCSDSSVEHCPANVFPICPVAEIGRMDLQRICRVIDQRPFARVAPDAGDLQLAEIRAQRFDLQSR